MSKRMLIRYTAHNLRRYFMAYYVDTKGRPTSDFISWRVVKRSRTEFEICFVNIETGVRTMSLFVNRSALARFIRAERKRCRDLKTSG